MLSLCPFIIGVKPLAVGSDIHIEDGRLYKMNMFFGDDGFFGGIHAADGGTVVVSTVRVPGSDALNKSDPFGNGPIRRSEQVAAMGARRTEQSFKFNTRHHVRMDPVSELRTKSGV